MVPAAARTADGRLLAPGERVAGFLLRHEGPGLITQDAAPDLKVTHAAAIGRLDWHARVDGPILDTRALRRPRSPAPAVATPPAGSTTPATKSVARSPGASRTPIVATFAQGPGGHFGREFGETPEEYHRYAADDPPATWHPF